MKARSASLLLLACAGLAAPRPLAAAVDRWTSTGPDVATVRALAVAPTGEVYAGTPFGVFRSTDRGGRWSRIDPTPGSFQVRHLAIDPGDARRVYAADNDFGGLYRSTAGGPWRPVAGHPADNARLVAVAPSDPDRLYIVEGFGVHVSDDRGATWRYAGDYPGSTLDVTFLHVDPRDADVLYAGSAAGGLLKSDDGGRTWRYGGGAEGEQGPRSVFSHAFDPRRPDVQYAGGQGEGIWKSLDAGATWRLALRFPRIADAPVALAVDPVRPRWVYAAVQRTPTHPEGPPAGEVWRSADAGATWTRVLATSAVYSLAIDPTDPRRVYVGLDRKGVLESEDRGATWRFARRGLRAFTVAHIAVDPRDPGRLWIAAPDVSTYTEEGSFSFQYFHPGLFRSEDGGRSWVQSDGGLFDRPVYGIALDPVRPERLFAWGFGEAFRSLDGGASWRELAALSHQGLTIRELVVDPFDPDRVYFAGSRPVSIFGYGSFNVPTVWKSADGGESWSESDLSVGEGFEREGMAHDVLIHPARPDTLYAGATSGFFRSRDGGGRWVRLGAGLPGVCGDVVLDPFAAGTLYALACHATQLVWKSTNFGGSWAPTGLRHDGTVLSLDELIADPHRRGTLYASGGKGLFATDDGGATWRRFESGLPPFFPQPWVRSLAADPHVRGRLYAGIERSGLYTILRTD